MPLSKLLALLQGFAHCPLCRQTRIVQQGGCEDCWQSLPWKKQQIKRLDVQCYVCCAYAFPLPQILHQLKDQTQLQHLSLLGACLAEMPKPRVQAIVPMPIARDKLMQRGFDPIYLLAHKLGQLWQLPVWQPVARHTGIAQRGLSRGDRLSNLSHLFYPITTQCRFKHVLMLDDVITTGASLLQLQLQLQALGCSHIQALAVCDANK